MNIPYTIEYIATLTTSGTLNFEKYHTVKGETKDNKVAVKAVYFDHVL